MKYLREKIIRFGSGYLDADIYELNDEYEPPMKRMKRIRVSPPHIVTANDRHSRNQLRQLIVHNFGAGDYYITATYAEEPEPQDAQREIANYITRLRRLYTKHGIEFKAIYVTEGGKVKNDGTRTRIHHHIVVTGGAPREEVERCWNKLRKSDTIKRGFCNTALIQPQEDERGCERIAEYMAKSRSKNLGKGTRRWNATRNIKRPVETIRDNKLSRRRTDEIIETGHSFACVFADSKTIREVILSEQWEKLRRLLEWRYKREVIDMTAQVTPFGQVYISARFRKKE